MQGIAERNIAGTVSSDLYAVKPVDFPGLIPKLDVRPGDSVDAGSPLFHDKLIPEIKFASPVSGKVVAINRGERRKILEVVVEKDGDRSVDFGKADPEKLQGEEVREALLKSGLWPAVRQRPYHIIANPASLPKSVFVSCFDTAPLAPDYNFILENSSVSGFKTGIKALSKLTGRKVNLVLKTGAEGNETLEEIEGVEISYFSGPHPAGNVGIHIHHLDPVNKGEAVWYVNFQDVIAIGRLFDEGIYKPERLVALTGSEVLKTGYFKMLAGAAITGAVEGNVKEGSLRFISGNVLTGTRIERYGFLGFYDSQITVIPEGNYFEMFGWALPGAGKLSFSRTFLSSLFPRKIYKPDTNLHGGERAFVVTGLYEKVLPMDIYPMHLLKAIIAHDIDMMENLGIYEVAEEDFALCEFVCPSKIEIQSIVRDGLELIRKEMS